MAAGDVHLWQASIRSPADGEPPRTLREVNALWALGNVYDKPQWWRKWATTAAIRRRWTHELRGALVRRGLEQVLAVWPGTWRLREIFQPFLDCAALPSGSEGDPKKAARVRELTSTVFFPPSPEHEARHFGLGHHYAGDSDSGDEYEDDEVEEEVEAQAAYGVEDSEDDVLLDEDGAVVSFDALVGELLAKSAMNDGDDSSHEEARGAVSEERDPAIESLLRNEHEKNSVAQIGWYFKMVIFREQLCDIECSEWTTERVNALIDEAMDTERIDDAVRRATAFIMEMHSATTESSFASSSICESRPDVQALLHFHARRIHEDLDAMLDDVRDVLRVVIRALGLDEVNNSPECVRLSPGPAPQTWMSDALIDDATKMEFLEHVSHLENVPEHARDWHPRSMNQVLNLIHPSLYCIVYGETPHFSWDALAASVDESTTAAEHLRSLLRGHPSEIAEPSAGDHGTRFQWLPSEVDVSSDGKTTVFRTYINNLHPETHAPMYESLARIFGRFVPLFDHVLSAMDENFIVKETQLLFDRHDKTLPCPPAIAPSALLEQPFTLRGRRCQVIVKISEIHLTPSNPRYAGGSWHIEGTEAEAIIATGIYYFSSENITESRLSFRVFVRPPEYEKYDDIGIGLLYGLRNQRALVQNLGSVTAREGRCVVFPNTLQHRVEPFELADPTRPGVRKILAFFLVDPDERVHSTAVVPPQQREWLDRDLVPLAKKLKLPEAVEANLHALQHHRGMTLDAARAHRRALMTERSPIDDAAHDIAFSLCEH